MEKRWDVSGLRAFLMKEIIGQEAAINKVCDAMEQGKRGVVLAGPCGCGKTLIARKMSEFLYGTEYDMRYFDMFGLHKERYVEDVKRLILEHLAIRPDALLLFDEIEWPHPKMRKLLFSLLADEPVKTWEGEALSMDKTFLIFTTKGEKDFYLNECGEDRACRAAVEAAWVELKPLTQAELRTCIHRNMERTQQGVKRINVWLTWDESVPEAIAQAMEEPACGRQAFHQVEEWKDRVWRKIYQEVRMGEAEPAYLTVHCRKYDGRAGLVEVELGHKLK